MGEEMSYLQITTRCNMVCQHCCYSCRPGAGKHMDEDILWRALDIIKDNSEYITIGGGEPTLHPQFMNILKRCTQHFDYVWLATNGTNAKVMGYLAQLLDEGYAYDADAYDEDDLDSGFIMSIKESSLGVALSQDWAHGSQKVQPKQWVVDKWERMARQHRGNGYEVRNVFHSNSGAAAQGRAKRTGAGWGEHCVCNDLIFRPDGKIKACGCTNAPVVGDVWSGISEKWEKIFQSNRWDDGDRCWNNYKQRGK